jgi:hypothetical protein
MIHLPGHPYAILKNKLIIDILATDHNEEILPMLVEALGGDQAVNCCEYGYDAVVGGDVHLGRLRHPKPFQSWRIIQKISTLLALTWDLANIYLSFSCTMILKAVV